MKIIEDYNLNEFRNRLKQETIPQGRLFDG